MKKIFSFPLSSVSHLWDNLTSSWSRFTNCRPWNQICRMSAWIWPYTDGCCYVHLSISILPERDWSTKRNFIGKQTQYDFLITVTTSENYFTFKQMISEIRSFASPHQMTLKSLTSQKSISSTFHKQPQPKHKFRKVNYWSLIWLYYISGDCAVFSE